jgi:hypothetical protein
MINFKWLGIVDRNIKTNAHECTHIDLQHCQTHPEPHVYISVYWFTALPDTSRTTCLYVCILIYSIARHIQKHMFIYVCILIYSIARHIQKHMRLFSVLEAMDNGKTIRETRDADIPIVIRHFYHHAGWAQLMETEMRGWKSVGRYPCHGQWLVSYDYTTCTMEPYRSGCH